ncbi:uncharacterized protein GLRG_01928 [Colletotrichum graminicola M1.001]|uniref:Major facilitator superfamily (MFS) profile domain-containing protein n=1 Tax=Colletotrichum graminicola (strain M1.001 / M2 / FGSC 10212) TaxID=645133 RepID=E3Q8R9_COLGM|nr:uncharacterized protein GLRG_01928 [Colletotrichum graminicola M1.001]EFQ27433.1 hypothetical protein GLRG_01928 [Colletotrichum graminicola M1.001]
MAMSAGILSSPMLGGLVYSAGGYYAVFSMCFGLIAVDTVMRLMAIDVKTAQARQTKPQASISHLAALWGTLAHGIVTTSFDSTLPLFVSERFHWDSVGAGLIFLPLVSPSLLGPLVGAACDRWGARLLSSFGFLLATPFFICLRFVDGDSLSQKVILCVLLAGVGIAMALVLGPLMAEITWVVEEVMPSSAQSSFAQTYGLYNMAFSGGALLGPILGGMIRDAAGWGTVGWTLGLITFVTAITQVLWTGGPVFKHRASA